MGKDTQITEEDLEDMRQVVADNTKDDYCCCCNTSKKLLEYIDQLKAEAVLERGRHGRT